MRAGCARAPTRIGPLPQLPTVAESGFPDYEWIEADWKRSVSQGRQRPRV
jgi:hypothetical protein